MSTFQEVHYFKSKVRRAGDIPNYYRLTVDGFSIASSSRYVSGYFDEETLDAYFNEFSQPAGGALARPSQSDVAVAAAPVSIEPAARGLQGRKLMMILSSNSDDIANQIGALAASRQFTASLGGLINRDQYAAAATAESRLTVERARARATASLARQLRTALPEGTTRAAAEERLLAFVNALASDLGYDGAFPSLDAAAQWLQFNRARLLRGE